MLRKTKLEYLFIWTFARAYVCKSLQDASCSLFEILVHLWIFRQEIFASCYLLISLMWHFYIKAEIYLNSVQDCNMWNVTRTRRSCRFVHSKIRRRVSALHMYYVTRFFDINYIPPSSILPRTRARLYMYKDRSFEVRFPLENT